VGQRGQHSVIFTIPGESHDAPLDDCACERGRRRDLRKATAA
jgi:hypothetical protein